MLIPVAVPPHKDADGDPGAEARVELCRLAIDGEPGMVVSTIEVERAGRSYTVDTLRALHDRAPADELTFIAGADMAASFGSWREPRELLHLARLAVAGREGVDLGAITPTLEGLHEGGRVVVFDMPPVDVSSSEVRRRIAAGLPLTGLVPAAVAARIAERGWYRPRINQESTA